MASNLRRIGRLAPSSSMLFVCDIQEAFRKTSYQLPTVIQGTTTLVSAAKELQVPVLVTTQNAARLGDTVSEINAKLDEHPNVKTFDKTLFSMWTSEVQQYFESLETKPKSIILCGIEGHVCVLQTCLDLLDNGFDVHVISDAVSSSTAYNRSLSLEVWSCGIDQRHLHG